MSLQHDKKRALRIQAIRVQYNDLTQAADFKGSRALVVRDLGIFLLLHEEILTLVDR